ncbi:CynX/NimT family MFS transporter [Kurthia senegalensis]|uniref:CynX/NimT family MFS transporter n=1 Tax=Kurthia senegalensis TaxID=1033740 RepID=UPI000288E7A0|nr:MFS transporter [Kurthia senegalensis]
MQQTQPSSSKWTRATWLFVLGIVCISFTMRSPITSVGPIIDILKEQLHISNVVAGFITTIPLLAFAIVSPIVPKIARKYGIERALFLSLFILAAGVILRSTGSYIALYSGTVLLGIGIAFSNVLMPSILKLRFPLQIGLLTGIFTVAMNVTASIAAGVSYPLATSALGWQGALGIWLIFIVIAIAVWFPQTRTVSHQQAQKTGQPPAKKIWQYPLTWALTFAMGLQSFLFYTTASWIPSMLVEQGMSASAAGIMFSIMQLSQIPMTFLIPILAGRKKDQRSLVVFFTILYMIGFGGLFLQWTNATVIWMIALGLAGGASFGLCMMFFSVRARNAYEAAELSGFGQSIGYLLAATGPVLYGFVHDQAGSFHKANIVYIIVALLVFIFSYLSAKDRYVTND